VSRAIVIRLLVGLLVGGGLGAVMGYYGKCSSGACPLTATPIRGAIYGAVMGILLAYSMAGGGASRDANTGKRPPELPGTEKED
jgi:hypothetical protein